MAAGIAAPCLAIAGATHGSFHTTISALEALLEYERFRPERARAARAAQARGREFLLVHRLFRSHRTGEIAKPAFTRFVFPARWHYDALRGLDYFRDAGAPLDARLADAFDLVEGRRRPDGRWLNAGPVRGEGVFRSGAWRRQPLEHVARATCAALARRGIASGAPCP